MGTLGAIKIVVGARETTKPAQTDNKQTKSRKIEAREMFDQRHVSCARRDCGGIARVVQLMGGGRHAKYSTSITYLVPGGIARVVQVQLLGGGEVSFASPKVAHKYRSLVEP